MNVMAIAMKLYGNVQDGKKTNNLKFAFLGVNCCFSKKATDANII